MNAESTVPRFVVWLLVALLAIAATSGIVTASAASRALKTAEATRAESQQQMARLQGEIRSLRELITVLEAEARKPPAWEYRIEAPSDFTFDAEMAAYGAAGWELVTARRASSGGIMSYEMIFKRIKR